HRAKPIARIPPLSGGLRAGRRQNHAGGVILGKKAMRAAPEWQEGVSHVTMTDTASPRRIPWDALAVAPFIIFAVMFLFLPTLGIIGAAFTDRAGNFTFDNIFGLFTDQILAAYWISIRIS